MSDEPWKFFVYTVIRVYVMFHSYKILNRKSETNGVEHQYVKKKKKKWKIKETEFWDACTDDWCMKMFPKLFASDVIIWWMCNSSDETRPASDVIIWWMCNSSDETRPFAWLRHSGTLCIQWPGHGGIMMQNLNP